ncbi:mersacidin/lichenicidin family type 2 lantibiotic [Synechocystis sp. PCC 7509]|uniref:mersacidin/lichenicidin family type 2 lantibiotic n=1 Tax=Synechocystis sp. PCC 7509 TaxID=927677 RepID=UPI0002AC6814|nr:mersacidin/lichenicidin family type 2 lantibiotic [Synechocystis sp. PCC 7509]
MSHENIVRAWKDTEFCNSLSEKERLLLPENPVGLVQLTDAELGAVVGRIAAVTDKTCPALRRYC